MCTNEDKQMLGYKTSLC